MVVTFIWHYSWRTGWVHAGCVHVLTEVVVGLSIHLLRSLINGCFFPCGLCQDELGWKMEFKSTSFKDWLLAKQKLVQMIFSLSKIKFTKTWFCSFKLTCHYTKEALCVFVSGHHVLQSSDRVDNTVDSGGKRSISFPHPETSQSP